VAPNTRAAAPPAHSDRDPWLPGFEWALPAAFAAAVSACRFEQGDVLHAKRAGYDGWEAGAPGPWLQVLDPPRSARAVAGGADASRFAAHWGSAVELDVALDGGASPRRLATTQGRLFTCLWRGEVEALESAEPPEPPLLLGDLQRSLDASSLAALRAALGSSKRSAHAADAAALLFAMALDRASDASLGKADTITSALAARFETAVHDAAPADVGVAEAERFHPALAIRGIRIEAAEEPGVTEVLKAVLYSPGAKARGAGDGPAEGADQADRFSLARHGLLVSFAAGDA